VSWAGKLGTKLNCNGSLAEDQLFQLFVLAVLWNNEPTFKAEIGEKVFEAIRNDYTLERFKRAMKNSEIECDLKNIAINKIQNIHVFNLLKFIASGNYQRPNIWQEIRKILELPKIGDRERDINRLRQLYGIFKSNYTGAGHLTVKVFLIFRELRIQFRESGEYQYNPAICCIPDSNVRKALVTLDLSQQSSNDIDSLMVASEKVAEHFCTEAYELYDLPLFFWYRENDRNRLFAEVRRHPVRGDPAGICPLCRSPLVWRQAGKTKELYRGCTNFDGGCRWKDRSY